MGVAFEPLGRLYYLDPGEADYAHGDLVLAPTGDGSEVARCVWGPTDVEWAGDLPRCIGLAEVPDVRRDQANRRRRAEIAVVARRLIARHELPMRVIGVDFVDQSDDFDQQAVIYFEAPGRVDFRALLIDLARTLQARIDLRQIGPRDAAAILGVIGSCGREACCATIGPLRDPLPAGLAREQRLPNNPTQFQGTCGRAVCCLAFESELYTDFRKRAPRVGTTVSTGQGTGVVVGHSVPLDSVVVQLEEGRLTCPTGEACPLAAPPPAPARGEDPSGR